MSHRSRRDRSLRRGPGGVAVVCIRSIVAQALFLEACAARRAFSTMTAVQKKPAGGLRNTLYEQQTRSGRRLTRGRLLLYRMRCRVAFVVWAHWYGAGAASCGWSAPSTSAPRSRGRLRSSRCTGTSISCSASSSSSRCASAGVKLGFLISPVGRRGIRGHDGAKARRRGDPRLLLAYRRAGAARLLPGARARRHLAGDHAGRPARAAVEVQAGRDPACRRCRSGRSIPMAYAASRAWKIKWDRVRHPEAVGARRDRDRRAGLRRRRVSTPRDCRALQSAMEDNLRALYREAQRASLSEIDVTAPNNTSCLSCIPDNLCENPRRICRVEKLWGNCVTHPHFDSASGGKLLIHNCNYFSGTL